MTGPKARLTISTALLLTGLLIAWLMPLTILTSNPPGPRPWPQYHQIWAAIAVLPLSVVCASLFWFRASIVFSSTCLAAFPVVAFLLFPDGRAAPWDIQLAAFFVLAACLLIGCLAAVLGHLATKTFCPMERPPSLRIVVGALCVPPVLYLLATAYATTGWELHNLRIRHTFWLLAYGVILSMAAFGILSRKRN